MKYLQQAKKLLWPGVARSNSLLQPLHKVPSQADVEEWKKTYSLACDMALLKTQIEQMKRENAARLHILLPHQQRLSMVAARNDRLLSYNKFRLENSPDNEDYRYNIETLEIWGGDLHLNLEAVEEAMEAKVKETKVLEDRLVRLIQDIADLVGTQDKVPDASQQVTEDSVLPPMLSSSVLESFEVQYTKMEEDWDLAPEPSHCSLSTPRSFKTEKACREEGLKVIRQFRALKHQRLELDKEGTDENRDVIENLTRQIHEVADELCIRGYECKDGSFVDNARDPSGRGKTFAEAFPDWRPPGTSRSEVVEAVKEIEVSYQGPRLFDSISDSIIEKPKSRRDDQDERWIVGAELEEMKQKIQERVTRWLDGIEDVTTLSKAESDDNRAGGSDGEGSLGSIAVGETLESDGEMDKLVEEAFRWQIDAWSRIAGRMFIDLPQEAQSAHPRNVASHA